MNLKGEALRHVFYVLNESELWIDIQTDWLPSFFMCPVGLIWWNVFSSSCILMFQPLIFGGVCSKNRMSLSFVGKLFYINFTHRYSFDTTISLTVPSTLLGFFCTHGLSSPSVKSHPAGGWPDPWQLKNCKKSQIHDIASGTWKRYMAQSVPTVLDPLITVPFGICVIYFDLGNVHENSGFWR